VVEGLVGVFPGILRQLRRRMWRPRTSLVGISVAATAGVFVGLWTLSGVPPSSTVPVHARPQVTPARGVNGPAGLPARGSHRGPRGVDGQTPGDSGRAAPVFAVGVTVAGQPVGNTLRRGRGDEPLVCTNVVPGPQPTCVAQPTQGLPPLPTPLRPGPTPP
jgi:hypothetical protein